MEELPVLIAAELKAAGLKEGKNITAIHPEAMQKLLHHAWRGNLRELSHTVRAMTLFCNGSVILPEHVVFPPDLESEQSSRGNQPPDASAFSNNNSDNKDQRTDLSLASAVKRHVRFVYEQANRNQRRAAKLLDISRATLARHLQNAAQK
jgi:DNA-binding NtrC family response regulator